MERGEQKLRLQSAQNNEVCDVLDKLISADKSRQKQKDSSRTCVQRDYFDF